MIRSIRLYNFRAFKDSGPIPLRELTCLVGRNSSGKSSLLNALLLLRQSVEERPVGTAFPQLLLNGATYEAGTYEDVVHNHRTDEEIGFAFDLLHDPDVPPPGLRRSTAAPYTLRPLPRWSAAFRPSYLGNDVRLKRRVEVHIAYHFSHEKPFGPGLSRLLVSVDGVGGATFTRARGSSREQHWRVYPEGLPARSLSIYFPSGRLFPRIEPRHKAYKAVGPRIKKRINDFQFFALNAFGDLASFLQSLRVLGPFRTPPRRRYMFSGFGALDAGASGQQAVDLLVAETLLKPRGQQPLRDAVSHWLKRLGLAKALSVRDLARRSNLFEVILSGAGVTARANFVDVGFGISQVLPVLVQGLLMGSGDTYVVQQPEIHLHPDAQAGLADFFIHLAQRGVRCVVETHSEYLLLRLRLRLAQRAGAPSPSLPGSAVGSRSFDRSKIAVVLLREGRRTGSVASILEIGDSFQFENLPPDFMTQSIKDRLDLLKVRPTK